MEGSLSATLTLGSCDLCTETTTAAAFSSGEPQELVRRIRAWPRPVAVLALGDARLRSWLAEPSFEVPPANSNSIDGRSWLGRARALELLTVQPLQATMAGDAWIRGARLLIGR